MTPDITPEGQEKQQYRRAVVYRIRDGKVLTNAEGGWLLSALDTAEARVQELEEALERIADAERAEAADPHEWAVWAHDLARAALQPVSGAGE